MSIIDTNVFLGRWPFRNGGYEDIEPIRRGCGKNGVDTMLMSSVHSIFYEDPFEAEEELHQRLQGVDGAYQVFTVNPLASGWQDDVRTAKEEFGVKALKIFPGYHGYSLQSREAGMVCEAAGKYGLPVILAMRLEDERVAYMLYQKPVPIDQLGVFLGTYRDNTIVISNISFGETMRLRPNILSRDRLYVDTAGFKFISFPIEKLLEAYPKELFIFGSQCPLYIQRSILNEIIRERLPEDVKEALLHKNAERLFGLDG